MTNYNERLDKILFKVTGSKGLNIRDSITGDRRADAKQAITSLIKELVAEAYTLERHIRTYMPEAFKDGKWHSISLNFKWNPDSTIDLGTVVETAIQSHKSIEEANQ